jgi:hypothetical protein
MPAVNPWTHGGVIYTQALRTRERSRWERVRGLMIVALKFRPGEVRANLRLLHVAPHRIFV